MFTQDVASPRLPQAAPASGHGLDQVRGAVDVLGLVPILNIPAEIASGVLSLRQRDYIGFGLSLAGVVPIAGEWAIALKIARSLHQAVKDTRAPASA